MVTIHLKMIQTWHFLKNFLVFLLAGGHMSICLVIKHDGLLANFIVYLSIELMSRFICQSLFQKSVFLTSADVSFELKLFSIFIYLIKQFNPAK